MPIVTQLYSKGTQLGNLWVETYAEAVLAPFGLESLAKYMAGSAEQVADILKKNPQLSADDFVVQRKDRPKLLVMGGTAVAPLGYNGDQSNIVSLQMSPDFSGIPFYPNNGPVNYFPLQESSLPPLTNILVGGGLMESFAFGSDAPVNKADQHGGPDVSVPAPPEPLSLPKAIGISSAAFVSVLIKSVPFIDAESVAPQATLWPITSDSFPDPSASTGHRYTLGDGDIIDNTGILNMLQRKVPNILAVISTDVQLSRKLDYCRLDTQLLGMDLTGLVTGQLTDKFGKPAREEGNIRYNGNNQVFKTSELPPLLCELQRNLMAGAPAIAYRSLEVQANNWWGIEGGWTVNIVFFLNEHYGDFEAQLPDEVKQQMQLGAGGPFYRFPFYLTVMQNAGKFTTYTHEQVNLLAASAEHMVLGKKDLFVKLLR